MTLHYDSLRAEPRLLTYFGIAGLDKAREDDDKLVVRATATLDERTFVGKIFVRADQRRAWQWIRRQRTLLRLAG